MTIELLPITWAQMLKALHGFEGGYVNDPDDAGGATNRGITQAAWGDWLGLGRIATPSEIKAITKAQADEFYELKYYRNSRICDLPVQAQFVVFDMAVNAGRRRAIKMLQNTLNLYAHRLGIKTIKADGYIGAQTIATAHAVQGNNQQAGHLRNAYCIRRRWFYWKIANRFPARRKYFYNLSKARKAGWWTRAEKYMDAEFHNTDAQAANIVRNWRGGK